MAKYHLGALVLEFLPLRPPYLCAALPGGPHFKVFLLFMTFRAGGKGAKMMPSRTARARVRRWGFLRNGDVPCRVNPTTVRSCVWEFRGRERILESNAGVHLFSLSPSQDDSSAGPGRPTAGQCTAQIPAAYARAAALFALARSLAFSPHATHGYYPRRETWTHPLLCPAPFLNIMTSRVKID